MSPEIQENDRDFVLAAWDESDDEQDRRLLDELQSDPRLQRTFEMIFGTFTGMSGPELPRNRKARYAAGREGVPDQKNAIEVNVRKLGPEERAQFQEADAKEWKAILDSGAVEVLSAEDALVIRRRHPDRILSSRMVRRFKPQPGLETAPLAKSRWCVRGAPGSRSWRARVLRSDSAK